MSVIEFLPGQRFHNANVEQVELFDTKSTNKTNVVPENGSLVLRKVLGHTPFAFESDHQLSYQFSVVVHNFLIFSFLCSYLSKGFLTYFQ